MIQLPASFFLLAQVLHVVTASVSTSFVFDEGRYVSAVEARTSFENAIADDPFDEEAHFKLAYVMQKHFQDLDAARASYIDAFKCIPIHTSAHNILRNWGILCENFQDF